MSCPRPSQWPPSVGFISSPQYHDSVPASMRALLVHDTSPPAPTRAVSPLVRIRRIADPSHPTHGQDGPFAHKKIPPRSHVIDYVGQVHCEERPDSDYDVSLYRSQDGVNVGIDARDMGNESRFINDYRGIQDKPNAEFVDYRTAWGELRMGIWSRAVAIERGDEILVSYGKAWWRCRGWQCTA